MFFLDKTVRIIYGAFILCINYIDLLIYFSSIKLCKQGKSGLFTNKTAKIHYSFTLYLSHTFSCQ